MKIMSSATTNLLFGALTMINYLHYKFPHVFVLKPLVSDDMILIFCKKKYNFETNKSP